jgi:hypothetical protein
VSSERRNVGVDVADDASHGFASSFKVRPSLMARDMLRSLTFLIFLIFFAHRSFTDRQKWIASIERNAKRGEGDSGLDSDEEEAKGGGACIVSGWVLKKGGGNSTFGRRDWKKRFLVLTKDGTLYWFKKELHEHKINSLQASQLKSAAAGHLELGEEVGWVEWRGGGW